VCQLQLFAPGHDLLGKPLHTFPDHALKGARGRIGGKGGGVKVLGLQNPPKTLFRQVFPRLTRSYKGHIPGRLKRLLPRTLLGFLSGFLANALGNTLG